MEENNSKTVVCGPISKPLKTAKQLLNWREVIGGDREYSVPNRAFRNDKPKGELSSETLVCHDMRGGYLEDR